LQTLLFLAALVFGPRHGMLANRAKRRLALGTALGRPA
jgi:hypothetical protein